MAFERGSDWQDKILTVKEALSYMYKHSTFADVTLQARKDLGSSMCFAAHKMILATRSSVFADMFYSKSRDTNIISMNISPRILDVLLWYIYSDTIEIDNIEELLESFDAAVQYSIAHYSVNCAEKLQQLSSNFSVSNIFSVLRIANLSKSNELRQKCLQFVVNEAENVLQSEEILSISEETFYEILEELNLGLNPKAILKAVIKWMIKNNFSDKKFLSDIDFAQLTADDVLNTAEEFPNFFTEGEIHCIVQSLMIPESSEVPLWCKFSKTKTCCVKVLSPLPYEGMKIIKERALKLQVDCSQKFSKCSFYGLHSFQQDLLLKICIQSHALRLIMMELAFGPDYVPMDKLNVELLINTGPGKKMQVIKHYLLFSRKRYYVLFCNETVPNTGGCFNLLLNVETAGLGTWSLHGPVSNQKYRAASVSNCYPVSLRTKSSTNLLVPTVNLKPFSDLLMLVDSKSGEKKFIISALYFDTLQNAKKYMTW